MRRRLFLLVSLFLVLITVPTVALTYNMQVDSDMSKAFNILYSGGMRAEYDIGTLLPTDDVRAQASKSLEAYSNKVTEVRVQLKMPMASWNIDIKSIMVVPELAGYIAVLPLRREDQIRQNMWSIILMAIRSNITNLHNKLAIYVSLLFLI